MLSSINQEIIKYIKSCILTKFSSNINSETFIKISGKTFVSEKLWTETLFIAMQTDFGEIEAKYTCEQI